MDQHLAISGGLERLIVRDAVCMRMSAAIESLNRLDESLRDRLFGSDWPRIWATPNRIAHGYNLVNVDVIAQTVEIHIPPLIATLTSAIETTAFGEVQGPDATGPCR